MIIELDKKLSLTEKARKLSLFLLVFRLENLKMTILVIAWFEQEQRKKGEVKRLRNGRNFYQVLKGDSFVDMEIPL